MQTEVVVSEYTLPKIKLLNKEEIKKNLNIALTKYDKILTEETLEEGKKDRADLNKLIKTIDGRRKDIKEQLEIPYKKFKADIDEITDIIKSKSKTLDVQIKNFEKQERIKKYNTINQIFKEKKRNIYLELEDIFDERWYLKGTSISKITKEIEWWNDKYDHDIGMIKNLDSVYETILIEKYIKSKFKLVEEIQLEDIRLKEKNSLKSKIQVNNEVTVNSQKIKKNLKLEILVTEEQLIALNNCFIQNKIMWRKI